MADPRNPIYSTPPTQNPQIDYGDNTSPNLPHQASALLKSITKQKPDGSYDFGNLTTEEIKDLDATLEKLVNESPLMTTVVDELKNHKIAWLAETITTSSVAAFYDAGSKNGVPKHSITFNRDQYEVFKRSSALEEELIHALQHKMYGKNMGNRPTSNIELEAKLIRDLINQNSRRIYDYETANKLHGRRLAAIPGQKDEGIYDSYINAVTCFIGPINGNESLLPKNMNELSVSIDGQVVNYWTIMNLFTNAWANINPNYAVPPNTNQNPDVLFWLANNCSCSYRKI